MILRRFMKHVSEQNWFAVGLDVLVVITGIFLGMQVTDWNETRKSIATADAHIGRILVDLQASLVVVERAIEYYSDALQHAELAADALDGPAEVLDEKFLINLYQASQTWNITINRGAYDELKQAGALIQTVDADLRTRLGTYYQRQSVVNNTLHLRTGYKAYIRKKMTATVQKAIRLNCGDRYADGPYGVNYIYLAENCEVELSEHELEIERARFHGNDEFREELNYVDSDLGHKVRSLQNLREVTVNLLTFIEESRS